MGMRIVFMGTGEIALPSFTALLREGHSVVGLVTQPDRPVGRHQVLTPPPLKPLALESGIPVLQPESLREDAAVAELAALEPDIVVVMAYGQILTQRVLDLARVATVNLHASLLPLYRGASCIQAAIAHGDGQTGVTLMHIVRALDAGDIIARQEYSLDGKSTGGAVHDVLANVAAELLLKSLPGLIAGTAARTPQDEALMTYAPKLLRRDGLLDWSLPAAELERLIRAYCPWPGTFTTFRDVRGKIKNLKIHPHTVVLSGAELPEPGMSGLAPGTVLSASGDQLIVACGEGALGLRQVQPEGGRNMVVEEFLRGSSLQSGSVLGE